MIGELDWRRPHPLTVLVLVASFVTGNGFPLLFVFAFGGGLGFDTLAVAAGVVTIGFGALGWFMTGYAITDEAVHYRSGILNRQARSIPLARIQQVSVAEPVLARIVGLAVVQVVEASADGDIEISYLGKDDASALTSRLRTLARQHEAVVVDTEPGTSSLAPPPDPPAALLHTTPTNSLIVYSLAAIAPGLILLAAVAFATVVVVALGVGVLGALVAAGVGVGLLVLIAIFTTTNLVLVSGGFRLERSPRSLRVEAGLLSRRQVEVRPERIQTLTVSSGPIVRRLNLHQIAFSAATGKAATKNSPIVQLSPAASTDEVGRIVQGSVDVDPAFAVELEPVSVLTIRRQLVRAAVIYLLVLLPASVVLWLVHPLAVLAPTLVWWPVAVWFARERHRQLGISVDQRRLVVRRGVLEHHLTQVPLGNIQSVSTRASLFQRRLGLAHLIVSTAGVGPSNHVVIPDLPVARCRELELQLAEAAASTKWELRA